MERGGGRWSAPAGRLVGPRSARRRDSRGAVAVFCVGAVSSMALAGMWAGGAATTGSAVPVAYTTRAFHTTTTESPTTTVAPTTTTTAPPPPPPTTTTTAPPPPPPPPPPAPAATAPAPGSGCGAALAYLASHAAPGFTSSCPGPNDGHQATTTAYYSNGQVTGTIGIEDPCPAAYMNEAHNSWVLRAQYLGTPIPDGLGSVIDPYGYCH